MEFEYIKLEKKDNLGYIILNRADKRNALNFKFVKELQQALDAFAQDMEVKVIILKAEGKVFSAGADLAYLQQLQSFTFEENLVDSTHLAALFEKIYKHDKIIIAQIEGHAIAGGAGLASVCDFSFAVPEAKLGFTEVKIGFIPAIVSIFVLRKLGETKAKDLLLSGRLVKAEEAVEMGLITKTVAKDEIEKQVYDFARELCVNNSIISMNLTKKMIADIQSMKVVDSLQFAAKMNAHARNSIDCKHGIQSFLNKQEIKWE